MKKTNIHLRMSIIQALQFLLINQRKGKDTSQNEFSRKCGLSRQYIAHVERGRRMPAFDFIFSIAEGFDMDIKDFMQMLVEKILYYKNLHK